ncbi:hypothetical protein FSP39_022537 [Pinctada imbricata]|uniref:Calcium-activated chloride channel N-terminal domain-containing protein n=1 Tax=Pinctada imbricata TaxID=66713 RepID=A0AA88XNK4_PINIB|nr:hypothetical protein FSP39_022537 [Pinctada imbricata]
MSSQCTNPPICGKPDRFLIHEFATYRYGVFNEFPFPGEDTSYFSPLTGRLERVRCSLGQFGRFYQRVNGQISSCTVDPDTGTYTDQCQYVAYPFHNQGSSSLMEYQWRQETVDFCDDTVTDTKANRYGHNREPHTQQNRLCEHRSCWDVISHTQDFINNINPPTNSYIDSGVLVFHATSRKRIAFFVDMADVSVHV